MARLRLDALMVQQGLASGRDQAKGYILAGQVLVNGQRQDKAGMLVDEHSSLSMTGKSLEYVSRGGLKLEKALDCFGIILEGCSVLDLGASTGGFTDCCLKRGAVHVTAVDVGYGQLAWSLRNDPRVRVLERTNARHVNESSVGGPFDMICADLSFISLTKVLPAASPLVKPDGRIVMLIKPQFEAGREQVGKKGVVRDPGVHGEVIQRVLECAASLDLSCCGLTYSPVTGPEGNIEYLACFAPKTPEFQKPVGPEEIGKVVEEAAAALPQVRR